MGRVCTKELYRFMVDCLKAAGANPTASSLQADLLIQAERVGNASHGLNRLDKYVNDIIIGSCQPNNEPCVVKETVSTALVDANNVLGATAGHYALDIAINKAKTTGIGWVTVRGSNHFGIGGCWASKAADQGMIGIALTNTSPLMAPTRSKKAALGTNPIAVAAPAAGKDRFYLDMATTAVALGKIEMHVRRSEPIPTGWAQSPDGSSTTDAKLAYDTKCLMPLGGTEKNSGFKGYALSTMVELFCGISSGSAYGNNIRTWGNKAESRPANLGQCFVAIDPNCFAPGFGERLHEFLTTLRTLEPTDPNKPVLAPGDMEMLRAANIDNSGSVKIVKHLVNSCEELAKKLNVKPLEVETNVK